MDETRIPARRCQQLEAWHRPHQLVLGVYRLSRWLPDEERTQLSAELRRAAVCIPANILAGLRGIGPVDVCVLTTWRKPRWRNCATT